MGAMAEQVRRAVAVLARPSGPPPDPTPRNRLFDAVPALVLCVLSVEHALNRMDRPRPVDRDLLPPQLLLHPPEPPVVTAVVVALLASAPLALRRRYPLAVIADDRLLVRTGFRMSLTADGVDVVAEATNGVEAVDAVRRTRPDVVLMDVRMPELDGLEATRRILSGAPGEPRVVILTTFDLDHYVYAALSAGASGFLLKDMTPEHLVAAVRLVRTGDALPAPTITRRLVERFAHRDHDAVHRDLAALTPRELEVLRLPARGLSNAEPAGRLHLSEATVKTHVARIPGKLGLRDRVQTVIAAYETGLVTPAGPTDA